MSDSTCTDRQVWHVWDQQGAGGRQATYGWKQAWANRGLNLKSNVMIEQHTRSRRTCRWYSVSASSRPARKAPSARDSPASWVMSEVPSTTSSVSALKMVESLVSGAKQGGRGGGTT